MHIEIRQHKLVGLPLTDTQNSIIIFHLHCYCLGLHHHLSLDYCHIRLTRLPAFALAYTLSDLNMASKVILFESLTLLTMLQWLFMSLKVKTKVPIRHAIIYLTSSETTPHSNCGYSGLVAKWVSQACSHLKAFAHAVSSCLPSIPFGIYVVTSHWWQVFVHSPIEDFLTTLTLNLPFSSEKIYTLSCFVSLHILLIFWLSIKFTYLLCLLTILLTRMWGRILTHIAYLYLLYIEKCLANSKGYCHWVKG